MTETAWASSLWTNPFLGILVGAAVTVVLGNVAPTCQAAEEEPRVPLLSNTATWERLPPATTGQGRPLPSWARMLAGELPRSTAALLQLDLAQRTRSPIAPRLRAGMRWISAHANQCSYAEAVAAADGRRAGLSEALLTGLGKAGYPDWTPVERTALEFARKMTVDSDSVTDPEFAELVRHFGEKQAASMVLLLAYSNFQDRLLTCLGAPLEEGGPLPPADVVFPPAAFVVQTTPPPALKKSPLPKPTGSDLVEDDLNWSATTYGNLQDRLELQRQKPTRLRVPAWDEVAANLPAGLMKRPSDIIWYRIVFGYAPELAVPFEVFIVINPLKPSLVVRLNFNTKDMSTGHAQRSRMNV